MYRFCFITITVCCVFFATNPMHAKNKDSNEAPKKVKNEDKSKEKQEKEKEKDKEKEQWWEKLPQKPVTYSKS